jgi:hypothetical protein
VLGALGARELRAVRQTLQTRVYYNANLDVATHALYECTDHAYGTA